MTGTSPAVRDRLRTLLDPVVAATGYEIDGLSLTSVGRRTLVRLTVDGDGGVDLDAVAEVTRAVSAALDEADPLDTPFVLEVSSPGVDRPLTEPRHWRRATGRLVHAQVDGRELTGRVRGVDDTAVRFEVDGADRLVPLAELGPGRVQIEFTRPEPAADGHHTGDHHTDGHRTDDHHTEDEEG